MSIHQLRVTDFDRDFWQLEISHLRKSYLACYFFLSSLGKRSGLVIVPVFSISSPLEEDIGLAGSITALAARSAHIGTMVLFDSYQVTRMFDGHLVGLLANIVVILSAEVLVSLSFEPVRNIATYFSL